MATNNRKRKRTSDDNSDDNDTQTTAGIAIPETPEQCLQTAMYLHRLRNPKIYDAIETCKLLRDAGYTHRLNDTILSYDEQSPPITAPPASIQCAWAYDNALPPTVLAHMKQAFDPYRVDANFWTQNAYSNPSTGFFSFTHALDQQNECGFLDRVIQYVHHTIVNTASAPDIKHAQYAEWWAHCRRAGEGHQLHFDSANEGSDGSVRHPICTAILYLADGNGGPTLITTQTRTQNPPKLAESGWLAYPRENRMVVLDGRYLHGVVPGRHTTDSDNRRITIMISYWTRNEMLSPFPPIDVTKTWARGQLLERTNPWWIENHDGDDDEVVLKPIELQYVSPVWLRLDDDDDDVGSSTNATDAMPHYSQCFQGL